MYKVFTLFCCFLFISQTNLAQLKRCSTIENEQALYAENPNYYKEKEETNSLIEQYIEQKKAAKGQEQNIIYDIPVVFHVVYKNTAQNIPVARINEQITRLNEDFSRTNTDASLTPAGFLPIVGPTNIRFHLATTSPTGATTTGIVRTSTASSSNFTVSNNNVKKTSFGGVAPWDPANYLNIWVCEISGSVLGYAQFPGGTAATDGVVIGYQYVGNTTDAQYNKGRTATHEVGHYLGLLHIWGDDGSSCSGSDAIGDTPNQAGENYFCPSFPLYDGCATSGNGAMFMNYMDYVDDDCMNAFTLNQTAKMESVLASIRVNLPDITGGGGGGATVVCTPQPVPFNEGFETAAWYPANWVGSNGDGATTWARSVSVRKSGTASFFMDNYNYNAIGQLDAFYTPAYNLGSLSGEQLTFWVAYTNAAATPTTFYDDALKVYYSTNCGSSWVQIYSKSGNTLATAPTQSTTSFIPTASQWRQESINIGSFGGITNFKFENVNGYGNQLYIDDINIAGAVPIEDLVGNEFTIQPNPSAGFVTLLGAAYTDMNIQLINASGRLVYDQTHTFEGSTQLDFTDLAAGVYFIRLNNNNMTAIKKLVLTK